MTLKNSLWTQCPLCERDFLDEGAFVHGPGECVPLSHALQRYLACEKRARRRAGEPDIEMRTHDQMDSIWLELSAAERAWINARGMQS